MGLVSTLEIENFRGISELKNEIALSDFNVLIGKNNAGKTAILESLYLLLGGDDPLTKSPKDQAVLDAHGSPSLTFRYTGTAKISAKLDNHEVTTHVESSVDQIFVDGEDQGNAISDLNQIGLESMDEFCLYFNTDSDYADHLDRLRSDENEITAQGIHASAAEFISNCVSDKYSEIYMPDMKIRKVPMDDTGAYYLNITDLGEGIVRTLPVFMAVEYYQPSLFLWDDIEASLHPSLLDDILTWLVNSNSQVVLSTHSMDVLSSIIHIEPDDVSVLNLAKSDDGLVTCETYDYDKLEEHIADAAHDPRFIPPTFDL